MNQLDTGAGKETGLGLWLGLPKQEASGVQIVNNGYQQPAATSNEFSTIHTEIMSPTPSNDENQISSIGGELQEQEIRLPRLLAVLPASGSRPAIEDRERFNSPSKRSRQPTVSASSAPQAKKQKSTGPKSAGLGAGINGKPRDTEADDLTVKAENPTTKKKLYTALATTRFRRMKLDAQLASVHLFASKIMR